MLTGSDTQFDNAVRKARRPDQTGCQPNALGQNIMHFAVLFPRRMRLLLEAGIEPDHYDKGGSTPLMYAAAYGISESVLCLLEHGARSTDMDQRNQRVFLDYAVCRNHQNVILDTIQYTRSVGASEAAMGMLDRCLVYYMINGSDRRESDWLRTLFALDARPDVACNHGTLMHHIAYSHEGQAILDAPAGFTAVNHADEDCVTPLMSVQRIGDPKLIVGLISRGASANLQDRFGWTALHHIADVAGHRHLYESELRDRQFLFSARSNMIASLNEMLRFGADTAVRDHCRCPCSSNGCSPMTLALRNVAQANKRPWGPRQLSGFPIDLLFSLRSFCPDALDETLRDIVRFRKFEDSGLDHLCCLRRTGTCHFSHRSDAPALIHEAAYDAFEEAIASERVADGAASEVTDRLCNELGAFYANIEARSCERRSVAAAQRKQQASQHTPPKSAKLILRLTDLKNTASSIGSRYVVDYAKDEFREMFIMPAFLPAVTTLDLAAHRGWAQQCQRGDFDLHLRGRLPAWSNIILEVLQKVEDSMKRSGAGELVDKGRMR